MSYKTLVPNKINLLSIRLSLHFFDNGYKDYESPYKRTVKISSRSDYYPPGYLQHGFSNS